MQAKSQSIEFQRFGRTHQMRIQAVEDLYHVLELDDVHWVATSAPVNAFHGDASLFKYLDIDSDGRIRTFEVRHAIEWTVKTLRNHQAIINGDQLLTLSDINRETAVGNKILLTCEKVIQQLGREEKKLTLGQIREVKTRIESTAASPAGVVLPDTTPDQDIQQFMVDVIAVTGGKTHQTGVQGVTGELLQQFIDQTEQYIAWQKQKDIPEGQSTSDIMPFGLQTPNAYELFNAIRPKFDQYYALCRALAYDPRCADTMQRIVSKLASTDISDPDAVDAVIANAPVAAPNADRLLDFTRPINPAYTDKIEQLKNQVLEPLELTSNQSLTEKSWLAVKATFSAYEKWLAAKPGTKVGIFDIEKLQQYLQPHYRQAVMEIIEQTKTNAIELRNIELLEKLLLYQTHLLTFINNFVSFPHLYTPGQVAMFDRGTLVMDGRRFNLAVGVQDRKQHIEVAKTSDIFTLYLLVTTPKDEPDYEIAVAVTSGGQGNLCMGKRGVFYDTRGRELDAMVVHIIENPISLQEAMISPFKRLGRLITGKIESITTSAEKKLDQTAMTTMTEIQQAPAQTQPQAPVQTHPQAAAAQPSGNTTGSLIAGGGIAVAALGSSLAFITKTLSNLHYSTIFIALAAAVLAVVGPMLLIAYLKLRRRDMSAVLEGSGWAINLRMRLTHRLGRYFTQRPIHPAIVRNTGWWILLAAGAVIIVVLIISQVGGSEKEGDAAPTIEKPAPAATEIIQPDPQKQ